jgi:hypothetical protein
MTFTDPTQPLPDHGPAIARIGDISVTSTTVHTPGSTFALRGSQWSVTDQWVATQRIPTWAVMCAVFGFCVLAVFSLLFLLVKEYTYRGAVTVTVTNGAFSFTTRVTVATQEQVQYVYDQVNYARALAAV